MSFANKAQEWQHTEKRRMVDNSQDMCLHMRPVKIMLMSFANIWAKKKNILISTHVIRS